MSARKAQVKGKDRKGKEEDDPNKLTNVDRTFYELTIADINAKISRLRSLFKSTEISNRDLKEQMRSIREDHTDEAGRLYHKLVEVELTLSTLTKSMIELTNTRDNENAQSTSMIEALESKLKSMRNQLMSQLKLLNGKKNSMDEFIEQNDLMLTACEEDEENQMEMEQLQEEEIKEMEEKYIAEQNLLKKEVETRLLEVSEDFMRSTIQRNTRYTRRLIRENIALRKEVDQMVTSQTRMQIFMENEFERKREVAKIIAAMNESKEQVLRNTVDQLRFIEKLTKKYERLKAENIELNKYQKLYDNILKRDICEYEKMKNQAAKIRKLERRKDKLKIHKELAETAKKQYNAEFQWMSDMLLEAKALVQLAIGLPCNEIQSEKAKLFRKMGRNHLLHQLERILSKYDEKLPYIASGCSITHSLSDVLEPGRLRTITSPLEVFKRDKEYSRKLAAISKQSIEKEAYKYDKPSTNIIPKARDRDGETLFDVEMGSELIVSSSHDAIEEVIVEQDYEFDEEGDSSSDDFVSSERLDSIQSDAIEPLTRRSTRHSSVANRHNTTLRPSTAVRFEDDF